MTDADQERLFPIRGKRPRTGRARRGLDLSIKAMRDLGRLESIDEALLALARIAADELDHATADPDESRFTVATLAGRYHAILTALLEVSSAENLADLAALFGEIDN